MSWASSEAVAILSFLLPGLVAVAAFHMFTSHPRPSEFERIVQALIFTILVQAIAELALWIGRLLGHDVQWREESEFMVSVGIALILGLIAVYLSNTDTLHRFVRFLRLTKETSYPSEWYSAFHHNPDCYVVLHLQGQRRLYGWPEEWPSQRLGDSPPSLQQLKSLLLLLHPRPSSRIRSTVPRRQRGATLTWTLNFNDSSV